MHRQTFPLPRSFGRSPPDHARLFSPPQSCRPILIGPIPPRSPKLNGYVERAQCTHTEEFYEIYDEDLQAGPLNRALRRWEQVYNTVRPNQFLGYLTPKEYLDRTAKGQRAVRPGTATSLWGGEDRGMGTAHLTPQTSRPTPETRICSNKYNHRKGGDVYGTYWTSINA